MLLVDGHSSHYEPETIQAAADAEVVMFCLPPYSTHVAQPLDVIFFWRLKVYSSEAYHKYVQENPGHVVTKYSFSPLFAEAWYKAICPANFVAGFVKVGVYPFNPESIKIPSILPGVHVDEGGVSGHNLSDLDNETPGDNHLVTNNDPSMDWQGDDKSGENSLLKESHCTPKQFELFEQPYENGYDLYTNIDYVAWLMENHPEDVPDEILGEMGGNFDHVRSDPFQPFEEEPKSPKSVDFLNTLKPPTEDNEQNSCERANLSSSEPSVERMSASTSSYNSEPLSVITELTTSSPEAPLDPIITNSSFSSSELSLVIPNTPLSSSNTPFDPLSNEQSFVITELPNSFTEQSSIMSKTLLSSSNAPLD